MSESGPFKIGDAGKKGKGVFAARRFEPSELVWDYSGEAKDIRQIDSKLWQYCLQVDYDTYVVPERGSVGWYLNHSCEPNCVIMGRTRVVALRRVEPGEELTFDYSTNVGWDGFAMRCGCGANECRKVVRSYSKLPEDLKGHYGACVSAFLLGPAKPPTKSLKPKRKGKPRQRGRA
jgi:uncharacterized protein